MRWLLWACLLRCALAYVSHTFNFPKIPMRVGVYHIHSPEYFLDAHGICAPGFELLDTHAPSSSGEYHVAAFSFRTLFGRMEGRVFTNEMCASEFMLLDQDGRARALGRLKVWPCGVGHTLRVYADRIGPAGFWDVFLGGMGQATQARVEAAVRAGYCQSEEDPNLCAYRRKVIYK